MLPKRVGWQKLLFVTKSLYWKCLTLCVCGLGHYVKTQMKQRVHRFVECVIVEFVTIKHFLPVLTSADTSVHSFTSSRNARKNLSVAVFLRKICFMHQVSLEKSVLCI